MTTDELLDECRKAWPGLEWATNGISNSVSAESAGMVVDVYRSDGGWTAAVYFDDGAFGADGETLASARVALRKIVRARRERLDEIIREVL